MTVEIEDNFDANLVRDIAIFNYSENLRDIISVIKEDIIDIAKKGRLCYYQTFNLDHESELPLIVQYFEKRGFEVNVTYDKAFDDMKHTITIRWFRQI